MFVALEFKIDDPSLSTVLIVASKITGSPHFPLLSLEKDKKGLNLEDDENYVPKYKNIIPGFIIVGL